jgi:hypothetical protein
MARLCRRGRVDRSGSVQDRLQGQKYRRVIVHNSTRRFILKQPQN